ncbi:DUF3300 domain-containing protein [bacterium]|nr:DUF3300 domain-containing protein [bacterium]
MHFKQALASICAVMLMITASISARAEYQSVEELQQLAAPIAMCPDELLTGIFTASEFPEQISAAMQWLRQNPDFDEQQLEQSWDTLTWDPSVRLLLFSPNILQELDSNPQWTRRLHQAYTTQRQALSRAIQQIRLSAWHNNKLQSNDDIEVFQDANGYIAITTRASNAIAVPNSLFTPSSAADAAGDSAWHTVQLSNIVENDTEKTLQTSTYYQEPNNYNNYDGNSYGSNYYYNYYYNDYDNPYAVPHDAYGRPINPANPVPPYPAHQYSPVINFGTTNLNSVNGLATQANVEAIQRQNSHATGPSGLATEANAINATKIGVMNNGNGGLATEANANSLRRTAVLNNGNGGLATAANDRANFTRTASMGGTSGLATAANAHAIWANNTATIVRQKPNSCRPCSASAPSSYVKKLRGRGMRSSSRVTSGTKRTAKKGSAKAQKRQRSSAKKSSAKAQKNYTNTSMRKQTASNGSPVTARIPTSSIINYAPSGTSIIFDSSKGSATTFGEGYPTSPYNGGYPTLNSNAAKKDSW